MDKMRAQVGTGVQHRALLHASGKQCFITTPVKQQLYSLGSIPGSMLLAKEAVNIRLFTCMQAERWGSELLTEDVELVDLSQRPFTVRTSDTEVQPLLLLLLLIPSCPLAQLHCILICSNSIAYSCYCARQVKTHSIIIATGATAKKLGIPSEEKFWSQGISACAICDGMRILPFVSMSLQQLFVMNLPYLVH